MQKEIKTQMLLLDYIVPDSMQPRKNFNAERLAELMDSIKQHGIVNPIIVHKFSDTKYILVDGERRYRASIELGLKEVPVIVRERTSDFDRLIEQFHIQEQHEGWSALEKAIAVSRLSVEMGKSVAEIAQMLSLPPRTIAQFVGFSRLIEKQEYQNNEIPVHYATHIVNLKNKAKRLSMDVVKEEFTKQDESNLELSVIGRIKAGEITKPIDLTKIQDSFVKDPAMIRKFIDDKSLSIDKMFVSSDANIAKAFRQINQTAILLSGYLSKGATVNAQSLFEQDGESVANLVRLKTRLDSFLNLIK